MKNFPLKVILTVIFLLAALLTISYFIYLNTDRQVLYNPGVYVNESQGYYSTLIVEVTVDAYRIMDIKILSHEEPPILSEVVFKELPPRIIKANSTEVDGISGATFTSSALLEAVDQALIQAKEGIE